MTQAKLFADTEGVVRSWARSRTALTQTVGANGIFFGSPKGRPLPLITMQKIDSAVDEGEANLEDVLISFAVWGVTKHQAAWLAARLKQEAEGIVSGTMITVSDDLGVAHIVRLDGARVVLDLFQPDTAQDPPVARYIVDIRFTLHALS